MSMDRRFPWMFRIADAPRLDHRERARAGRIAGEVCRRTGTNCAWDAQRGGLHFYYGDRIDVGVHLFVFKAPEDVDAYRVSESDVDDMVRLINMGRISRAAKDRIAAENAAAEKNRSAEFQGQFLEANRKDALDFAEFRARKRRGMERVGITT